MQMHEKVKCLVDIKNEDEFRTELMIPLLRKMGHFSDVLDNQGPDEAGVDIIGCSTSPFKKAEYTAFVLKHGNITLKAADRTNNIVGIIETQLRQAIRQPLSHPRLSSTSAFAGRVIVATNGTISKTAQRALRSAYTDRGDINLDFIGQDQLIEQIDQFWPRFYEDRRPFLSSYATKLYESLNIVNLELLGYAQKKRQLSEIYIDTILAKQENVAQSDFCLKEEYIAGNDLCKQGNDLIVITSGPGGGKSTLLKELAISQSRQNTNCAAIYLHAREILQSSSVNSAAMVALQRLSGDHLSEITSELSAHRLLLLVDGLDELATVADRESVIDKLIKANRADKVRVVLATRPESNPGTLAALASFTGYKIQPLRTGQIRSFFGKWFGADSGKAEPARPLCDLLQGDGSLAVANAPGVRQCPYVLRRHRVEVQALPYARQ